MARYLGPKYKKLRRFGMLVDRKSAPGARKSDYGIRLEEKQKLKFVYGILERQLRRYLSEVFRSKGDPAHGLILKLETRLDNIVYRLGFAKTLGQARQMVNHGHVRVNGKRVNIPSYGLKPGQVVSLKTKTFESSSVAEAIQAKPTKDLPKWLEREGNTGSIIYFPAKTELPQDINMNHIIEFYS